MVFSELEVTLESLFYVKISAVLAGATSQSSCTFNTRSVVEKYCINVSRSSHTGATDGLKEYLLDIDEVLSTKGYISKSTVSVEPVSPFVFSTIVVQLRLNQV